MKFLFIENREKTLFWEKVALRLEAQGHTVFWLVQNHAFRPRQAVSSHTFVIPYPAKKCRLEDGDEAWVLERHSAVIADRGRRFFRSGSAHYEYYKNEIKKLLHTYHPDIVVGESTLFHELLTIALCREVGITYVHPASNRYPRGRFSLLAFDTQIPVIESSEECSQAQARDLAQRIATSTEIPFYMHVPEGVEKFRRFSNWALNRVIVWSERLKGECYNTPSLTQKYMLHRQLKGNLLRWKDLAQLPNNPDKTLLYPMQLQPESNIDVWGSPYSNQVSLIKEMRLAAPLDYEIAVKVNPKAKYEVSDELLQLAHEDKRICLLPLELSMQAALAQTSGAVTVTGTIGFEAMCGKGRAISLRHPVIEREFPAFHAKTPEEAVHKLINDPAAGLGNIDIGSRLIQRFVNQSFPGIISDPVSCPACINQGNIKAVADAVSYVQLCQKGN